MSATGTPGPIRREVTSLNDCQSFFRGRGIKSCLECRRRKMRCSRSQPCQNCSRFSRNCHYVSFPDPYASPKSNEQDGSIHHFREKGPSVRGGTLSEHLRTGQGIRVRSAPSTPQTGPAPLATHEELYSFGVDKEGLTTDLQIGRLRITERICGLSKDQLANRIAYLLSQNDELTSSSGSQLLAASAGPTDLDLSHSPFRTSSFQSSPSSASTSVSAPWGSPIPNDDWESYFPSYEDGHLLYCQYFAAVDPLAHVIHRPSFDLECYNLSLLSPDLATTPASFKALLLAVFFAAAVSLSSSQAKLQSGIQKPLLVAKLRVATERALADAKYTSSPSLQTLQAFTIYLIPQCTGAESKSRIASLGTLVYLAESIGLHRNTQGPHLSAVEGQVRKLLWYQICFLDLQVAESSGSQPRIRDDGFDTPLPFNINDADLGCSNYPLEASNSWMDATFALIRAECYLVHRLMLRQIVAIGNTSSDINGARRLIDQRRQRIEDRYLANLDGCVAIHRYVKLVCRLLTARWDVMLLYKHVQFDEISPFQHALRDILLNACLQVTESAALLETAPDLSPWAWYAGAYQQYHAAIFMLMEVYRNPDLPSANRVNAILNHVFGRSPNLDSKDQNRATLRLVLEKLGTNTQTQRPMYRDTTETYSDMSASSCATARSGADEMHAPWQWQPIVDVAGGPVQHLSASGYPRNWI